MKQMLCLVLTWSLLFSTRPAVAQVAIVDYMRVKPGNEDQYIQIEKAWKKIHEARKKSGKILNWNLYQVSFTGADAPYQFVTVTIYERLGKYADMEWNDFTTALSGLDEAGINNFFNKTIDARVLAHTGVYSMVMSAKTTEQAHPGIIVVNYMQVKPGGETNYLNAERSVFKPVHEEMIRQKQRTDWSLWQTQTGDLSRYQYITVDGYTSLAQLDNDFDAGAVMRKVHAGKNVNELVSKGIMSRQLIDRQIWRWIDGVN